MVFLIVLPLWRFVPDLPRFAKKCLINDMCFCRKRVFLFLFKMVLARSGILLRLWVPLESSQHPHDISWAMALISQMGLRISKILPRFVHDSSIILKTTMNLHGPPGIARTTSTGSPELHFFTLPLRASPDAW